MTWIIPAKPAFFQNISTNCWKGHREEDGATKGWTMRRLLVVFSPKTKVSWRYGPLDNAQDASSCTDYPRIYRDRWDHELDDVRCCRGIGLGAAFHRRTGYDRLSPYMFIAEHRGDHR